MKKAAVVLQIAIVFLIILYGTVSLFRGRFEDAFATFPFLLFYYVYVVVRQKRKNRDDRADGGDPA